MITNGKATKTVALVYVRVSRLDEDERQVKLSPGVQRERALALPELTGFTTEVFEDLDFSGKDTLRPDYQRMLIRLQKGDVAYVVAYDLSRITRDVSDQQAFAKALQRGGAMFLESARGRVRDLSDEDEEFVSLIEGAGNQRERKKTARRVRDTFASQTARGVLIGSLPPGYLRKREYDEQSGKVTRRWVEVDEAAAEVVRTLFREYASGRHSHASLARWLNAQEVPPLKRRNAGMGARLSDESPARRGVWTSGSIKDLLRNARYAGRVSLSDGRLVESKAYPAIVDAATYEACERVRMAKWFQVKREPGAGKTASPFLLSGLLRCAKCGSTMSGHTAHGRKGQKRRTYRCYALRLGTCSAAPVAKDDVEAELVAVLGAMALPPGFARAVDSAVAARTRTFGKVQKTSAGALAARQDRLNDMYLAGSITKAVFDRDWQEIQQQRAALASAPPAPLFTMQQQTLRSLTEEWDGMTDPERSRW